MQWFKNIWIVVGNDGGQVRIKNEEQKDLVDVLLDIQKENLVGLPIDRVSIGLSSW